MLSSQTTMNKCSYDNLPFTEQITNIISEAMKILNFDSSLKEEYYMEVSGRHLKTNFRNCLKIIILFWYGSMIFDCLINPFGIISLVSGLCCTFFLICCYIYTIYIKTSNDIKILTIAMILVLIIDNVFNFYNSFGLPEINFTPTLQICLLTFTNLQLKLHISLILWFISYGLLLMTVNINVRYKAKLANVTSNIFRDSVFALWQTPMFDSRVNLERYLSALVLLGLGITMLSMYLFLANNIRRRAAFLRLGYNVQIKHQLRTAMKSQVRWIEAIMPKVIKTEYVEHIEEIKLDKWVYVKNFDNVSILFADIVGFTKICSNKGASEVVTILNDLFNRFDELCSLTNCEKLGTLGDCYYCVAGCPISRPDHAVSCIEMGLGMCRIIKQFNLDYDEDVNMRVGVHTGRVNAAVIGKNRFRFDVYSNDVIIANSMESTGKPGFVHISQSVYGYVRLLYKVENGNDLEIKMEKEQGIAGTLLQSTFIKTYFIDPKSPHMQHGEISFERRGNLKVLLHKKSTESCGSFNDSLQTNSQVFVRATKSSKDKLKQDTSFIEGLKFDPERQIRFFIYPPVNIFSLMFVDKEIEWNFNTDGVDEVNCISYNTFKLTTLYDCVFCLLYSILVYMALLITFPDTTIKDKLVILANVCFSILLTIISIWESYNYKFREVDPFDDVAHSILSNFIVKSLICFYFLSTPLIIVIGILNDCSKIYIDYTFTTRYFTLILFSLFIVPFFLTAHYFVKVGICCLNATGALLVVTWKTCGRIQFTYTFAQYTCLGQMNVTDAAIFKKIEYNCVFQIFMTFLLMILIIRELEMNIRLLFYVTREAGIRNAEASEAMKNAEQLLYNIIPKYVFNQLMTKSRDFLELNNLSYAMSIPKAGVVFACISNFFSKYYREDYKGGENALKLLHKIICYFDDIIRKQIYRDVEKIKTINDCYMVASGLNIKMLDKNCKNAHLYALMHYCFDMIKTLEYFNENYIIGNDQFEIKIGYNFGPVTAGIIGKTKPMYDIWGDTVNVSSRMYSTGSPGFIQVPKHVVSELDSEFTFEYRGQIFVKGKGDMDTYICTSTMSSEEISNPIPPPTIPRNLFGLKIFQEAIRLSKYDTDTQLSKETYLSRENPTMRFKKTAKSGISLAQNRLFVKSSSSHKVTQAD